MKKQYNILESNINKVLISLAIPMVAANFAQTAFGLIDMMWVGRLGSQAVSAIGTASFYLNLATALSTLITVGVGVKYAQYRGAKNYEDAQTYLNASMVLTFVISLLYTLILFVFARPLIGFFNISDIHVVEQAIQYLRLSLIGAPILFFSLTFTSLLTSQGKTQAIFKANIIGLVMNTILDPLLIFGVSSLIPTLGINGAALATVLARFVTFFILYLSIKENLSFKFHFSKIWKPSFNITKLGLPVASQRVIFIFISMVLARIIAQYGTDAISAQKIGLQIESISYVTIGGLQGSLLAFVGQNYGAENYSRIKEAYRKAIIMTAIFSLIITSLFLLFPRQIFSVFISEEAVITRGVGYMQAIGISQLFMCVEYITVGVFNGLSKTYIPPIVSVILTALRIPLALLLSKSYGVDGIWWSISISSILKGCVLFIWMSVILNKGVFKNEKVL